MAEANTKGIDDAVLSMKVPYMELDLRAVSAGLDVELSDERCRVVRVKALWH